LKEKSYPISKQVYTATEDKDFIDFLEKCLMMDHEKRMTPEQGMKHRWIT
jgi:serine/threonine protein kinase|tara:strand:+ start:400 stop:549 length:150 start_codon:yes stop_codon:yes gene_type:complete